MRNTYKLLMVAAVLALAFAGVLAAQGEETTITGQLSQDDAGGYILVEQESGESIMVSGSAALADHVGKTVTLTGEWMTDDQGKRSFKVSKVEPAAEEPPGTN